jgi:hypothetical protein
LFVWKKNFLNTGGLHYNNLSFLPWILGYKSVILFLKWNIMLRGSFSECREGQLQGGMEVAGNSRLSATSFLSDFYLIVEIFLEEKATCNFSYMRLQATQGVSLGACWL